MYHGQIDVNRAVSYRSCVKSSIIKSLILLAIGVAAFQTSASKVSADFTPNWFVDFGTLNDPTCSNSPQTPKSVTVGPATFSNGLTCGGNYEHFWHSSNSELPWPVKVRVDFSVPVYGLNVEGEGYGRIVYRDNFYTWIKDNGSHLWGGVWEPNVAPYSFRSEDTQNGITFIEIYTDSKWCLPTDVTSCHSKVNIHKLNFTTTPPPSNLTVLPPRIDTNTGDLYVDYRVNTYIPFRPNGAYVPVEIWAGNSPNALLAKLGHWNLDPCVNKGNCSYTIRQPFSQREMVPRGYSWMTNIIDPLNTYKEINEGDNSWSIEMDDFFMEKIPAILGNRGLTWGKEFLNNWMDAKADKIKNPSISAIDWKLNTIEPFATAWFLNTSRIKDVFNIFIRPSPENGGFLTTAAKEEIAKMVREKFKKNPTASSIVLSDRWGTPGLDFPTYHRQHFNSRAVESYYYYYGYSSGSIDDVTAAFGRFAFYMVPFGTAQPTADGTRYLIKFKELAIHVADSYDFNDVPITADPRTWTSQALGCYSMPDVVKIPFSSGHCVSNSTFRWYRWMKVRGKDFNIFTTPYNVRLDQSVAFYAPK